ncbi:MAG: hypothetical protein V7605_393 [Acidimicrobiaceae bacterium]
MTTARDLFDRLVKPVYVRARDTVNGHLERRHHINTMGSIQLEELGVGGEGRNRYEPSEWMVLRRVLPRREVGADDVFIDVGSGMGRVVFQAAGYPFKRVIGVELSEELNRVARANIENNRDRLFCRDVELVTADATDYRLPDDVTVAYFANPFTGDIFRTVIEQLLESLDRRPRRLRLIYRNPVEHDYLMSTGRFRPVRRLRGWRPTEEWSVSNSTRMYEAQAGT